MTAQPLTAPAQIDLPPVDTKRWSPSRKAAVVAAARAGLISRQEACARYMLSDEELVAWERDLDENGVAGLRTTRLQCYRPTRLSGSRQRLAAGVEQHQLSYR